MGKAGTKEGKKAGDTRLVATLLLQEILEEGRLSHLAIRETLDAQEGWSRQERAFFTRLVEGSLERRITLDAVIDSYSRVPLARLKPFIRSLLRISLYQILYMESVPDSAACAEAVKLTQKRGLSGLKAFVNGLLRTVVREREAILLEIQTQAGVRGLSVRYSLPEWLITHFLSLYPEETVERMAASFLEEKPLTVRCYETRASAMEICRLLQEEGVQAEEGIYQKKALRLPGGVRLAELSAFQQGLFQPQDESSMLAVAAAGIKKGMTVVDVCAAPGGKSLCAADDTGETGRVFAYDLTREKVQRIADNAERCQFSWLFPAVWDALTLDPARLQLADVVLADLPCSGLGIMGRKNDIRYKMTPEAMTELAVLQRNILSVIWQYVKPGGILCYSTCTINPAENQKNREWILQNLPFEPVDLSDREELGEIAERETCREGYLQLLPGTDACDGFFFAVFRRQEGQA